MSPLVSVVVFLFLFFNVNKDPLGFAMIYAQLFFVTVEEKRIGRDWVVGSGVKGLYQSFEEERR